MSMVIPDVSTFDAGYIAVLDDIKDLAEAATFLLGKPMSRVLDGTGGVAILTTPTIVTFTTASFDPDGMWNVSTPNRLTIQTPGWYRVSYSVNCGAAADTFVSWVTSTSGANNPAGAGVTSAPYWSGSSDGVASSAAARPGGSGIWPFYLYAGDYLQVSVQSNAAGASTGTGAPGTAGSGGSFFELELVSI